MGFNKLIVLIVILIFTSQAQAALPDKDKLKALKANAEAEMANYKQIRLQQGKCLEVSRDQVKVNGGRVQLGDCGIGAHQKWMPEVTSTGTRIKLANEKCLQVSGDVNVPGTTVVIWDCNNSPAQSWNYVNGQLRTQANTCMQTAPDQINTVGAAVQIGVCGEGANQQWVAE